VSNRLPFVLKRDETSGQLERKARLVRLSCSSARRIRFIFQSCLSRVRNPPLWTLIDRSNRLFLPPTIRRFARLARRSTEHQRRRTCACRLHRTLAFYRLPADGGPRSLISFARASYLLRKTRRFVNCAPLIRSRYSRFPQRTLST